MILFNDPPGWLAQRIAGVKRGYYIPPVDFSNSICLDIGANVGAFPIVHAHLFKKIYCYEPARWTYDECRKNTGKLKNVKVYNYAVTGKEQNKVKLYAYNDPDGGVSGNASLINSKYWNEFDYEEVKTVTLQEILKKIKGKSNYVKMDVEGCEYEILMNTNIECIDYLALEIHINILSEEKMHELFIYLKDMFTLLILHGDGKTTHYEMTLKNNRL